MNRQELIDHYQKALSDLNAGKNNCDENFVRMFGYRGAAAATFQAKVCIEEFIQKLKEMT